MQSSKKELKRRAKEIMNLAAKDNKTPNLSMTDLMAGVFNGARVEPEKRMVAGKFGYAIHRFPIKNGKTLPWLLSQNLMDNNSLLKRMMAVK